MGASQRRWGRMALRAYLGARAVADEPAAGRGLLHPELVSDQTEDQQVADVVGQLDQRTWFRTSIGGQLSEEGGDGHESRHCRPRCSRCGLCVELWIQFVTNGREGVDEVFVCSMSGDGQGLVVRAVGLGVEHHGVVPWVLEGEADVGASDDAQSLEWVGRCLGCFLEHGSEEFEPFGGHCAQQAKGGTEVVAGGGMGDPGSTGDLAQAEALWSALGDEFRRGHPQRTREIAMVVWVLAHGQWSNQARAVPYLDIET